jgi:hypothetical protein
MRRILFWKVFNIKIVLSGYSLVVVKFFDALLLKKSISNFLIASIKFY